MSKPFSARNLQAIIDGPLSTDRERVLASSLLSVLRACRDRDDYGNEWSRRYNAALDHILYRLAESGEAGTSSPSDSAEKDVTT